MDKKFFDNTIIAQYAVTGVPLKVYVDSRYLTITDADDVENPLIGQGMEPNGEMEPFSYQDIDHLLVADNIIDLETYNTAMADQFKPDEPEEAPEDDEEAPEEEGEEGEDDMPSEEEPAEEEPTTEEGIEMTKRSLSEALPPHMDPSWGALLTVSIPVIAKLLYDLGIKNKDDIKKFIQKLKDESPKQESVYETINGITEISKEVFKAKMDVIKKQEKELKDKEAALKKEPIDEARFSFAGMMADLKKKEDVAMAARKAYLTYSDKRTKETRALANKVEALQDERSSLMSDMEQEAEPEGGKIANRYGKQLNVIDSKISELESQIITMGNKDRELRIKYEDAMASKKKARLSLKSAMKKESVNEAIAEMADVTRDSEWMGMIKAIEAIKGKYNMKESKKIREAKGRPYGLSKEETLEVAKRFAKALSITDGVKVTVNMTTLDEDSFDLDYDGVEFDGGSYNIYDDGAVKNMATMKTPTIGYKDDSVQSIVKYLKKHYGKLAQEANESLTEAKRVSKLDSKKVEAALNKANLKGDVEVRAFNHKDGRGPLLYVSYTNYGDRHQVAQATSALGYEYDNDGRFTNRPNKAMGVADVYGKSANWMSFIKESLVATNKKTGKDVTQHLNDYMDGKISKKEFEKLTGIKKESVNEAMSDIAPGSRVKVTGKSIGNVGKTLKGKVTRKNSNGTYEVSLDNGDMADYKSNELKLIESVNESIDGLKVGDKVQNQYDGVIATIKSIDGNSVTVVYDDMKSLRNEFGPEAKEFYNQSEELPMAKFKKAWDRKEYISYGSIKKLGPWANLDEAPNTAYRVVGDSPMSNQSNHPETVWASSEEEAIEKYRRTVKPTPINVRVVKVYESVNEAVYVPSNIEEFAKRRGALPLVKKIAKWAEKAGKNINGGTAIGKGYDTLILDLRHHGGEIRINLRNDEVTLFGEPIKDAKSFKKVYDQHQGVNEANSYDSWKERGNQLEKQAKADAINAFGKAAKRKDFEEMVDMFVSDREINGGEYLDAFRIVLKKYNLEDEFRKQLADLDITKTPYEMNENVSSPYIYQVGDLVHNTDSGCACHGSKGIVMSVRPEELTYSVTNSGDAFKPGMRLTKALSQLEAI